MRPHLKHSAAPGTREEPHPAKPVQTLASLLTRERDRPRAVTAPDPDPSASDDDVLDVGGVVRMLHVGRNKVYELVARNEIPHRRLGKQIRFSRAAIMRWLDPCSLQGAKERQ